MVILKFYVIKTSDNLPFQPYYSGLYTISYQKMHIPSLVQFMSKKSSHYEVKYVCTFFTKTLDRSENGC